MTQGTATFEEALAWLLADEAGYSDHPEDHGGPTNLGITQRAWSDYTGHRASADDIRAITRIEAAEFYDGVYWLPLGLAAWERRIAIAVLDMAALNGTATAMRLAQRALGVAADGIPGPRTQNAAAPGRDAQGFLLRFVPLVAVRFARIVKDNPTQSVFIEGWTRRAMRLLTL